MPPSFEMQTMTLKQENGALLKENSQLRVQLIQNDESCDEKLREPSLNHANLRERDKVRWQRICHTHVKVVQSMPGANVTSPASCP